MRLVYGDVYMLRESACVLRVCCVCAACIPCYAALRKSACVPCARAPALNEQLENVNFTSSSQKSIFSLHIS